MCAGKTNGTVLGFDFGTQWIGVAAGQNITGTAQALDPLKAKEGQPDWLEVEKIITEWQAKKLIIGNPLTMDDTPSELSKRAIKFANRLHGRFGLPIEMWDERLSSFDARGEIIENQKSKAFRKQNVDGISARLILESWLREHPE
jgi:putative Holliday junction resolvase